MAYGRSKMLSDEDVLTRVLPLRRTAHYSLVERREVEHLRSVNARLTQQLAALREREMQTQWLADRDALTGLFNRRRLLELLESSISNAAKAAECVGLLFLDLNGFKGINDEYGHAAGDRILTTVAKRIAARVRNADIVGRYGGDEFVVILPDVPDAAAVTRVADTIRERVALPYRIEGHEQHLTAAIGESLYPFDGDSGAVLLKRADEAMYRLKSHPSRPMLSISSRPSLRPSRRRNDKSRPRA